MAPEYITELSRCEVFVFGSNLQGQHAGGAARCAYENFGAEWGVGDGPTGQCYAIPTMHGDLNAIRPYVNKFIQYAKDHPMNRFLLTRIGCGIAGFKDRDMEQLFAAALDLPNIAFPQKWMWDILMEDSLGHIKERTPDEAPVVVSEKILKRLCQKYCYEIGAGLGKYLPKVRIRYVSEQGKFGYTRLENCFICGEDFYVWETDDKWADYHNQEAVESVFQDECKGRGFARRVIFAGVSTNVKDSRGEYIYTGDVIYTDRLYGIAALGACDLSWHSAQLSDDKAVYCFPLDNHFLDLAECHGKKIRIGTVFFRLNKNETFKRTWDRALEFNHPFSHKKNARKENIMARYTPNFDQEYWKYSCLKVLDIDKFPWNK